MLKFHAYTTPDPYGVLFVCFHYVFDQHVVSFVKPNNLSISTSPSTIPMDDHQIFTPSASRMVRHVCATTSHGWRQAAAARSPCSAFRLHSDQLIS